MRVVASAVVPRFVIWIGSRNKYKEKILWYFNAIQKIVTICVSSNNRSGG